MLISSCLFRCVWKEVKGRAFEGLKKSEFVFKDNVFWSRGYKRQNTFSLFWEAGRECNGCLIIGLAEFWPSVVFSFFLSSSFFSSFFSYGFSQFFLLQPKSRNHGKYGKKTQQLSITKSFIQTTRHRIFNIICIYFS